jgi:hypothetical protein
MYLSDLTNKVQYIIRNEHKLAMMHQTWKYVKDVDWQLDDIITKSELLINADISNWPSPLTRFGKGRKLGDFFLL